MPDDLATAFHLLRPWWLAALVPVPLMLWLILRREGHDTQWSGAIAPHLLAAMTVRPEHRFRIRPVWLVACALCLGIVALAGPTWRRELPPFVADKAPLMLALDVSDSMSRTDIAPSRLERAKQKIRDLLAARGSARTGLVAYAGTAHRVMPLTEDAAVLEPFLAALAPAMMPAQGKNVAAAVGLAAQGLAEEPFAGTILLVTDGLGDADAAALRQVAGRNGLTVLATAPPAEAGRIGLDSVTVTVDESDIGALERRIETRYQAVQADKAGTHWRDEGFWLLFPIAVLSLAWFRRGVTVQWVVLLLLWHGAPASAQSADAWSFKNLWITPDQQGRIAFERGDYARAKTLFADPMWRGIAAYRAYDFLAAAEAFQKVDSVPGRFALGNAQAQNHAYEKAIKAYQEVLAQQPDHQGARTNLAIVRAALEAQEAKRRKQEGDEAAPPDLKADEMKVDEKQQGGKRTLVQPGDVTTPGAAEAWMRQVQTSPGDFLKLKFAIQANSAEAPR